MAGITLSKVKKVYPGGVEAVKGVDLDIKDGEFAVLVGPSGCGKSTLLRMIAGLETISGGTVSIGDNVVNDKEPADRDIAMVFQNYALYPHMTVRQNMAYGLKNRRTPAAEIERRIDETARILQINDYLDRKPRALSGGQRQRVAMGRAIVREPEAFLFDEPLSNLDAKLRIQMRGEIKKLHNRLGTTSVYVTHDQLEAMTMADTLIVLNGGQIEQAGRPLDLYRNPVSTFVASFLGAPAMNLLDGTVVGGQVAVGGIDGFGPAPLPQGPVTVGVRPENLTLTTTSGEGAFRLSYVEELGGARLIHGDIDGQMVVAQTDIDQPLSDRMAVRVSPDHLVYFDTITGRRVGASLAGRSAATEPVNLPS